MLKHDDRWRGPMGTTALTEKRTFNNCIVVTSGSTNGILKTAAVERYDRLPKVARTCRRPQVFSHSSLTSGDAPQSHV